MADDNALRFGAHLAGITVVPPKATARNGYDESSGIELKGGHIELRVLVPRPAIPKEPRKPYWMDDVASYMGDDDDAPEAPPEFGEPAANKGESPADHKKRVAAAKKEHAAAVREYRADLKRYQETNAKRASERADYERRLEEHRTLIENMAGEFTAYAQLSGVAAVLGGMHVQMTIRPDQAELGKYLPGFAPVTPLLALGSDAR